MPEIIRALIVVIVLAFFAFYLGRQVTTGSISQREFSVWRNVWFVATAAGFLAGNFYIYAIVVTILVLYARAERVLVRVAGQARKARQGITTLCISRAGQAGQARWRGPIAQGADHKLKIGRPPATPKIYIEKVAAPNAGPPVYWLLLFVVPPVQVTIGGFGIVNKFLELNNPQFLAALILLPTLLSAGSTENRRANVGRSADFLIVSYVLLLAALQFGSTSVTDVMRLTFVYALNVLLPYFTFSRAITTAADTRKVLAAFVLAAFPLSLSAVFETVKGWPLYNPIVFEWGGSMLSGYLERSGMLRAMASAMQPIALGFVLMVAMGCFLALQQNVKRNIAWLGFALLGAGLVASLSRGPWIGAGVLIFTYVATGPNAATKLAKSAAIGIICLGPLLLTPIGSHLADFLPFMGSVDAENVEYRQRLFTNSLIVVERNSWFGSVNYRSEPEMQELLQGQGIVDVVNTYLEVVLECGLVGLTLFVGFFASILLALWRALRSTPTADPELRNLLRASIATLVAILVTIGTVGTVSYIPYVYWSFAGLCIAVIRLAQTQRAAAAYASRLALVSLGR
jgi:O-antigen ligase